MHAVRVECWLNKTDEHGDNLRDHLIGRWKKTGEQPALLRDAPEIPDHAAHVWQWFWSLNRRRSGSGFGGNPIGYYELRAMAALSCLYMRIWEVTAIMHMDDAYMAVMTDADKYSLDETEQQAMAATTELAAEFKALAMKNKANTTKAAANA